MQASVSPLDPGAFPLPSDRSGQKGRIRLQVGRRDPTKTRWGNHPQPRAPNRPFQISARPARPPRRAGTGAARSPQPVHPAQSPRRPPRLGEGGLPHPQEAADAGNPKTQRPGPPWGVQRGRELPPDPALTGVQAPSSPWRRRPEDWRPAPRNPRARARSPGPASAGIPPGNPPHPPAGARAAGRGLKVTAGRPGRGSPRSPFGRRPGAGSGGRPRRRGRESRWTPRGGRERGDASARGAGVRGTWCLGARVELLSGRGHAPRAGCHSTPSPPDSRSEPIGSRKPTAWGRG